MKVETKYNVGDVVFFKNNLVWQCGVISLITITANEDGDVEVVYDSKDAKSYNRTEDDILTSIEEVAECIAKENAKLVAETKNRLRAAYNRRTRK